MLSQDFNVSAEQLYRRLHRMPEIGLEEFQTAKFIRQFLQNINGLQVLPMAPNLPTAVLAEITPINSPRSLQQRPWLFRCQLDALPWREESGLSFAAINGLHHACGHDGHMAALLKAAVAIANNRCKLSRPIILCFQPGEEGKGGANKLMDHYGDLVKSVQHCFAIHLANHYHRGKVGLSSGFVTANSNNFKIDIQGSAAHSLAPQEGIDANLIGCSLVQQIYALKSHRLDPTAQGNLLVTRVQGGLTTKAVSDRFCIEGNFRYTDPKAHQNCQEELRKLSEGFCKAFGATCTINVSPSHYRSVENKDTAVSLMRKAWKLSQPSIDLVPQNGCLAGEDFCEFSERTPSAYCFVGAAVEGSLQGEKVASVQFQSQYPIHSPRHQFDTRVLQDCVDFWIALALMECKGDEAVNMSK